jgi:transcriptional regulator with XRE-family HTH domain
MSTLPTMPRLQVIPVIEELMILTGDRTQEKLGKRLGISQTKVSRWLRGKGEPTKSEWETILDTYYALKGWVSIDEAASQFDMDFQNTFRKLAGDLFELETRRIQNKPRRR